MSDFTERAAAEAERRMVAQREQVGLMVHEQQRYIEGFGDGVRWVLADPTPDEIEDAAGRPCRDVDTVDVHTIITAFLAERRGSE